MNLIYFGIMMRLRYSEMLVTKDQKENTHNLIIRKKVIRWYMVISAIIITVIQIIMFQVYV